MKAFVLLSLALVPLLVQPGRPAAAPKQLFFDDFAGPDLDRSHWNVVVTGRTVNNEQQAYIDSPDVFTFLDGASEGATNGALAIRPLYREGFTTPQGRRFDFVSGRADSKGKFEFMHGTASARLKLSVGAGLWPAFWILGTGQWPATGEIDVMEHVGEPDWTSVAIHGPGYSGDTPLVHRAQMDPADGPSNWHVYGVEWTADAMIFTIDGREIYRATRQAIEQVREVGLRQREILDPEPGARRQLSAQREQDRRAVSGPSGRDGRSDQAGQGEVPRRLGPRDRARHGVVGLFPGCIR